MILIITILSVVAFAFTNIFAKKSWQTLLSIIFAAIFMASLTLIVANDHYHFGMKKETMTTTETLSSSTSGTADMLLYQPLGNGSEKVYLYKTNDSQKKLSQTGTDKVTNKLVEKASQNQIITKKIYWTYKNDTMKLFFGLTSKNKELVREVNTFKVSQSWLVLSTSQAKKLGKLVKQNQATIKTEAAAYVQAKITEALTADPNLSQADQAQVSKEAAATYQAQAMAKLVAEAKQ